VLSKGRIKAMPGAGRRASGDGRPEVTVAKREKYRKYKKY
jgi:hypothetical protein